jgi:hypothetical protein
MLRNVWVAGLLYVMLKQACQTHRPHAAVFSVLCDPTHLSNYTQCAAPNVPVLINFKFQIHVKWLLVYYYFIFHSNKVAMGSNEIHICCACGKIEGQKINLRVKLGISKSRWV